MYSNETSRGPPNLSPANPFRTDQSNVVYTPRKSIDFDEEPSQYMTRSDAFRQPVVQAPTSVLPIALSKFSGHNEDPEKFLSDFEAFMDLQGIDGTRIADSRKLIASFSLHLTGPAFMWYQNLPNDPFHISWTALRAKFYETYVDMNISTNASLYAESATFNNLVLGTKTLDEFHCEVLKKGKRLHKTPLDLMSKFIDGLPASLQYFVRAGRPNSIDDAFQSAKMGEAVGYRMMNSPTQVQVNTLKMPVESDDIRKQLADITKKVDSLMVASTHHSHQPTIVRNI